MGLFFKKLPQETEGFEAKKAFDNLSFQISDNFRLIKQLQSQMEILETELRGLHVKLRDKIYKKGEDSQKTINESESFKTYNPFKI
jgi:hypothetical protein